MPFCRWLIAVLMLGLSLAGGPAWSQSSEPAVILQIDGAIGPAISNYIEQGFAEARERGAPVIILRMDTPGGLDSSMRDIIKEILASPIPVITYVSPSGGRAASAGTYILYASHVAAMAPGTSMGAATPVRIGGGTAPAPEPTPDEAEDTAEPSPRHPTMEDKVLNDAIAYIRSLAQLRKRNVEWAEKAVAEAATLAANQALEQGVIDLVATSIEDLLAQSDGRTVLVGDSEQQLKTAGLATVEIKPDWRTEFLAVITDPSIAYYLFLIGVVGLYFEFSHPGFLVPGIIGGTCLLLALFGFQLLPINYAGLALMGLGMALMIAEVFAPSFGALGIGGVIAFVFGSIMLIDTDVPGFGISPVLIGSVAFVAGGLFLGIAGFAARAMRRPVVSGSEAMIGIGGEVVDWSDAQGRVRVHGEIWRAKGPKDLKSGRQIKVTARDKLELIVEPVGNGRETPEGKE